MIYIYESHLGGHFISDRELDIEETFCETCGDCDFLGCAAEDWMEVGNYLRSILDVFGLGGYDMEYCIHLFNECCRALGGDNEDYIIPEEEND